MGPDVPSSEVLPAGVVIDTSLRIYPVETDDAYDVAAARVSREPCLCSSGGCLAPIESTPLGTAYWIRSEAISDDAIATRLTQHYATL